MTAATRVGLFLTAATLLTAACGLKPGVEPVYTGAAEPGMGAGVAGPRLGADGLPAGGSPLPSGGAGALDGLGGGAGGGAGTGGGGGAAVAGSGGGTTAGDGTGAARGRGRGPARSAGGGGGGGGGAGGPSGPVWGNVIKIGVHAPVTGAAAIPQESFRRGVGVYFDYVNRHGGIHGRKVQVLFEDDKFDPSTAVAKCKKLAEQEHVFLLIGAAGSDQIDACARYAASVGVPYMSAGVHQTRPGLGPLGNLRTYFAMTLAYEQQAPLVARRVAALRGRAGLIVASNDSLNSYFGVQQNLLRRDGVRLAYRARIPKDASGAEATTYATDICSEQLDVVAWNASPSVLLNVVKQMPCSGVRFVGPGLTNGLNVVAEVGCPQINGAQFYSPFPGMDVMRRDAQFVSAYRQRNGGAEPDDIGANAWGLEKLVGAMLHASGKRLTRGRFMATIASVKQFRTGVYPPTNFSSRFGGTAMHRLVADCGRREYVTAALNERP